MARLEIVEPAVRPRQAEIPASSAVIGRHPDCDVVLGDISVSRHHARIVSRGGRFFLEDLDSYNGTVLNGETIRSEHPLADRDEIQIGAASLVFRDTAPAQPDARILSSCDGRQGTARGDPEEKLRGLLDMIHGLGASLDLDEIFPRILETTFRIFPHAERGSIWLEGEDGAGLQPVAARKQGGGPCETPQMSRTVAQHVMEQGQAVLSADAGSDERFEAARSVIRMGLRSLVCAPLLDAAGTPLGLVQLDTFSLTDPFCAEDLDVLVSVANLAGHSVEHARLVESRVAFERRERDLSLAHGVQEQFLPRTAALVPGYGVAHHYRPAGSVGGDYFDYIELPDGRLAIALGDVAGKGVSAALMMARLCSDVRFRLLEHADPARAMTALGEELTRQSSAGRFVTLLLCVLDPASHAVTLVNAGHLPPLLRRSDGAPTPVGEDEAGPPLGVLAEAVYGQARLALEPGDALLFFTDGVTEARAPDGDMFGSERARSALAPGADARAILERLIADVTAFTADAPESDDLCAIALSRERD